MWVTEQQQQALTVDPLSVSVSPAPGPVVDGPHLRPEATLALVQRALRAVRQHLDMQVAFVGRIDGESLEFRHVAGDAASLKITPGEVIRLSEALCQQIERTRDTVAYADVLIDATEPLDDRFEGRIRSYLGVPILRSDGSLFGSLCGLSSEVKPRFTDRDAAFLRALADVVAHSLEEEDARLRNRRRVQTAVRNILRRHGLRTVFQPIQHLTTGRVIGVEALSRFSDDRPPDVWFDEAERAGLGPELELHAARRALSYLDRLPRDVYLALNVSPGVAQSADLARLLDDLPAKRLVIELTEHRRVGDYEQLARTVRKLQRRGCKVAVDDVGAGYSSFRHVVELTPDIVKVDRSLVSGLHGHAARRAFLAGLVATADTIGVTLVAEGVETFAEHRALVDAGLAYGQGFHLAHPAPLGELSLRR